MKRILDALAAIAIIALILGFAFFDILESYGGTVTTNLSNTAEVRGWRREELTYNTESNRFSREEFPSAVEASAARQVAAEIPALYTAATNTLITNLAPATAAIAQKRLQPVVMLTGAASLDNLLDRENLTMAVVSNEVTRTASGKHIKAYVALNKSFVSEPVMKARLYTPSTSGGVDDTWVSAEWTNYTNTVPLTLVHPQSYTNFVVATVTNEQTVVLTTNVEFSVIEDAYRQVVTTNRTEYQGLEYLESSGTQYLELDYLRTSYFEFDVKFNTTTLGVENDIVGNMPQSDYLGRFVFGVGTANGNKSFFYSKYNNVNPGNALLDGLYVANDYVAHCTYTPTKKTTTIGSGYAEKAMSSIYAANDICKLLLFTGYYNNKYPYKGKIYYFTIETDGSEWLDLVPVLHEGEGKMLDLAHNTLYANAGTGAFSYDSVTGTVAYTEISTNYVHYCVTNSETRAITLTNQVIVVTDGTLPRIVTAGDRETLECHILEFDVPNSSISTNLSTSVQRWVKIGDPETGFDYGNRVLRVNGTRTLTMTNFPYGSFYTTSGTALTNFNFFVDNGIFKVSEKKKEE